MFEVLILVPLHHVVLALTAQLIAVLRLELIRSSTTNALTPEMSPKGFFVLVNNDITVRPFT